MHAFLSVCLSISINYVCVFIYLYEERERERERERKEKKNHIPACNTSFTCFLYFFSSEISFVEKEYVRRFFSEKIILLFSLKC